MNFKVAAGRIASRHEGLRAAEGWDVTQSLKGGVYTSLATKGQQSERHIVAFNPNSKKFVHGYQEGSAAPTVVSSFDDVDALHDHALNGSHHAWDS